jgi:hypothetical protein
MPAPSVTSDGKALPHSGLVSHDFTVGNTNTTLLVVTNTGNSGTVAEKIDLDPSGGFVSGTNQLFTIPTLAAPDVSGGASASRAMKFSVSVVNCSNALKRGGRVTYLNSSQRLPARSSTPATKYADIISAVKSSPYRRRITGDCLSHPTHLIGFPVDTIAYTSFNAHQGTLSSDAFFTYVAGASASDTPSPRPMSVIVFVFDPVADQQDYSVTIRASYYTRWPLTSVPGQSMRNIPTADAKLINYVRDHAESTANDLAHIVEGGVIASVAPKLANAARSAGTALTNRVGDLLRTGATTAESVAPEILGSDGMLLAEAMAPMII